MKKKMIKKDPKKMAFAKGGMATKKGYACGGMAKKGKK